MGTAPKKKILVLDDEEALRVVLAAELEDQGYEAFALEDKTEGYEWTLQHRPDLIISDIKSPGMDGIELLRHLKANPITAKVPFLFVTGFADLATAILSKKLGAVDFVCKPYEFSDLLKTIARIFREDYHPPIYPPNESALPLFERGNILHAPWMKILRTFERGLIRAGARTTVLPGTTPWIADIVADRTHALRMFRLLRTISLNGLSVLDVVGFRRSLETRGLERGVLCMFSPVPPASSMLGGLLGIRILPPEETRTLLETSEDSPENWNALFTTATPNDEQAQFGRFAETIWTQLADREREVLSASPPSTLPAPSPRLDRIRYVRLLDGRIRFESEEASEIGTIGEEIVWEALTVLWTERTYHPLEAALNDELRWCLYVLLGSLSPLKARQERIER